MTDAQKTSLPGPPLPRGGQSRAWWRAPASPTALAWSIAMAAEAHDGPLLVVARDNHEAHQLEADLHTLLGNRAALPVPSVEPELPAVPASVVTTPPDVIFRIVWLFSSAM